MINGKHPIAKEAASTARSLVRARANGEVEFFKLVLREAVARGSTGTDPPGATSTLDDERGNSIDWQYALIASLATLASAALGRSTGVGIVDRDEARRRTDEWIEIMAEKGMTF